MSTQHYFITKILMLGIIASCSCNYFFPFKDKDDTGGQDKVLSIIQVPGCAKESLSKQADSLIDSCFVYQFDPDLSIEFCVTANCCPDSNRFESSCHVKHDTIFVAVRDTAGNLCKCVCPYIIRLNLPNPDLNRYIFTCEYYNEIIYNEVIIKE